MVRSKTSLIFLQRHEMPAPGAVVLVRNTGSIMTDVVHSTKEAIGFCCEPFPDGDGWTWTLTTRLGNLLREAEERYGQRDLIWTPIGIEFGGEIPHVWYPGNSKTVSIMLTESARNDPRRAIFQLAHEIVHLLAPTGGRKAPVIEEGIATIFSYEVAERFGPAYGTPSRPYFYSRLLTEQLLTMYPKAIKILRTEKLSFCEFTPTFVQKMLPNVPDNLAADLCEPFAAVEARLKSAGA